MTADTGYYILNIVVGIVALGALIYTSWLTKKMVDKQMEEEGYEEDDDDFPRL